MHWKGALAERPLPFNETGSRIRMVAVTGGKITTAVIKSNNNDWRKLHYDTPETPPTDGMNLIEGFHEGTFFTMLGNVTTIAIGMGLLEVQEAPRKLSHTFRGSFVRHPLPVRLLSFNGESNAKLIGLGHRQCLIETLAPLSKLAHYRMEVTDAKRIIEFPVLVEHSEKHGNAARSQCKVLDVPRVLNLYWQKLIREA